jgi:Tfp pilus assembly protein PilF
MQTLEEGLDYIIEDDSLTALFFEELSLSLKAMGNNKKATEYYKQALELKDQ